MNDFRCNKCHKLLGRYRDCLELEIKCPRCGYRNRLSQGVRGLRVEREGFMPVSAMEKQSV